MKRGELLPFKDIQFLPGSSERETDDEYKRVLLYLSETERLIVCKDSAQWVHQKKQGQTWRGVAYLRTVEGLNRYRTLSEAVSLAGVLRGRMRQTRASERPCSECEGVF